MELLLETEREEEEHRIDGEYSWRHTFHRNSVRTFI
jgi:hypothetical protein